MAERRRESFVTRRRISTLYDGSEVFRRALDQTLEEFNGTPADAHSFDHLERLLRDQAYRLAYWRVASDEINYRRFFDINDLAALGMEREEVFHAAHDFIFEVDHRAVEVQVTLWIADHSECEGFIAAFSHRNRTSAGSVR